MKVALELALAGGVALGLHVAAFALTRPAPVAGVVTGGADGADRVSLQAADAGLAALVAAWERPPAPAPAADLRPVRPEIAPALPAPVDAPALPQAVALPPPPKAEAPPQADPAPPAPAAVKPPPQRPEPRPERAAEPPPKPEEPKAQRAEQSQAPRPPSEGSRRQTVAAGEGQGDSTAQDGSADARAAWMGAIRSRIERHMRYPRDGNGASGTVLVQVQVTPDGALAALGIAQSSGVAALDQAALAIVRKAAPFRRAPRDAGGAAALFNVPLTFRP